jgi:hypothetical protein
MLELQNLESKKKDLIIIVLISLLLKLPYLHYSFLANDETTFILVGRDILDGYLPYIRAWDNKGPIFYLIFSISNLFSDPFVSTRILSLIFTIFSAFILYKIVEKLDLENKRIPFYTTIIFIITSSVDKTNHAMMTGTFVMPFILLSTLILIQQKKKNNEIILLSFCLSIIILTRQNLIIFCILAYFLLLKDNIKNRKLLLINLIFFSTGFLVLLLILLAYNFYENGLEIFFNNYYLSALDFNKASKINLNFIIDWFGYFLKSGTLIFFFLLTISLCLIKYKNKIINNIILINASLAISVLIVKAVHEQYLLILYPLSSVLISIFFYKIFKENFLKISKLFIIYFFFLYSLNTIKHLYSYNDSWREYASKINPIIEKDNLFSFSTPFYLLLKKELPTNIVHLTALLGDYPSIYKYTNNTQRSAKEEINKIFSKKIKWILIDKRDDLINKEVYPNISKNLYQNYKIYDSNSNFELYRIKNNYER